MAKGEPIQILLAGLGTAFENYTVSTYVAGSAGATPKVLYTDVDLTASAATTLTLDQYGRYATPLYANGFYEFIIKDPDGATYATWDNLKFGGVIGIDSYYWTNVSDYATFQAAVTAIGATPATLLIDADINCTDNITVPVTLTIKPLNGNIITISSGKVLTVNGQIEAEPFQIFAGTGTVTGLKFSYPEWWGIDGTADQVQINQAIIAVGSSGYVKGGSKTYTTAATIAMSGATGVSIYNTTLDLGEAYITASHTGAGLTLGNSDNASAVGYCTIKIGQMQTTSAGLTYGIKEIGTSTSQNTIIIGELGSTDAIKTNSMGICQMAAGLGNYYNTYRITSLLKWAASISCGYDLSTSTAATEASNRTYFYNTYMAHYNQYGIYIYQASGNEFYAMDFAGGTGVAATTIDLYLNYTSASVRAGSIVFNGYSESGNDVFLHLDSGCEYNVINMRGISSDSKVDDDNTSENNVLMVGKETRTENLWCDAIVGSNGTGSISLDTTTLINSDFTGTIGTLANSATPSAIGGMIWLTGGTTTITDITGSAGMIIHIIAEHNITITDGTNIFLSGSVNFDMNAGDTLTLVCKADGNWYELARGNNN